MEHKPGAPAPPAEESVERARGSAEEALKDVKHAVKDAAGAVKDKTREAVEGAQARAADQTRSAAHALRDTADRLEGDLPWLDAGLRKAADGLEGLTSGLNKGNLQGAIDTVSDFARRQPAAFLGLSVALGFTLARVGKTAVEEVQEARAADGAASDYREAVAPYAPGAEV
jgi:hypothetical protein